jgi:hypothetical protein
MLAMSWTYRRGQLIKAQRVDAAGA